MYREPKVTLMEREDRPQQFETQLDCHAMFDVLKLRQDAAAATAVPPRPDCLTRTESQLTACGEKPRARRPSGVNFAMNGGDADRRVPLAPAAGSPLNRRVPRTSPDFELPIEASLLTTL